MSAALMLTVLSAEASAPPSVSTPVSAQARALDHYARGRTAYRARDFKVAAREWTAAYALVPAPELLFNLGRAHEQAGRPYAASRAYERYLFEKPAAEDRAAVESAIARLQAQAASRTAKPGDDAVAAQHYRKGRELYQAGKYADALDEMTESYELFQSAALIYNIARVRERMGDELGASRDYRRYLELAPQAPDKGDVENVISALEERAAARTSRAATAGAGGVTATPMPSLPGVEQVPDQAAVDDRGAAGPEGEPASGAGRLKALMGLPVVGAGLLGILLSPPGAAAGATAMALSGFIYLGTFETNLGRPPYTLAGPALVRMGAMAGASGVGVAALLVAAMVMVAGLGLLLGGLGVVLALALKG